MKLSNVEFRKLLPEMMREDLTVKGLSAGVDTMLGWLYEQITMLGFYSGLEHLPEEVLDQLAESLYIPWYRKDADREAKASIIRNQTYVWSKLGTPSAIKSVLSDYYGSAKLEEWFQTGGPPYTFGVFLGSAISEEERGKMLADLNMVKNTRSHVEGLFWAGLWGYYRAFTTWGDLKKKTWGQVKEGT